MFIATFLLEGSVILLRCTGDPWPTNVKKRWANQKYTSMCFQSFALQK